MDNITYETESKKELLKHCRYYKGENKNPFNDDRYPLWSLEKMWVEEASSEKPSTLLLEYSIEFMKSFPEWSNDDIIPMSLKAIIHNRYTHFGGSDEGFKNFLKRNYPQ